MSIFGLVYRAYPAMAESGLAPVHFWLHLAGSLVLVVMLSLLMSGSVGEAAMVPLAPLAELAELAELAVMAGLLCFVYNLWRNAR